jgi:hypothetical protein
MSGILKDIVAGLLLCVKQKLDKKPVLVERWAAIGYKK